ncbi:MAG: dihydrodipicolinate synthetase, partial [Spirochaetaceae bacterium]
MVNSQPIRGFVAAPFTAMHPDRSINFDLIPAYAAHLVATGVAGAFVNGTTGEGYSLTLAERMATAEAWVRSAAGKLRVIVHVGAEALADARALATHAAQIGADAIASMAPVFFKPDMDGLIAYCADLAGSAPRLPFYYYHMPSMTGLFIPVVDFLSRAADRIPTLRGVKYTHYDLMDFKR